MTTFQPDSAPASRRDRLRAPRDRPRTRPGRSRVLNDKIKGYIDDLGTVWVEGEITQWGVSRRQRLRQAEGPRRRRDDLLHASGRRRARSSPSDLKQGDHVIALRQAELLASRAARSRCRSRHAPRRPRRPARAARAPARAARRRGPVRPGAQEAAAVPARTCIGLITGKDSDAEKDVLRNAQLRWPHGAVPHRPTPRCRATARVPEVDRRASGALDADPEVDVIIVARGGGDFQNLLGFSDETLRAGRGRGIHPRRQRDRARGRPAAARRGRRPARLDADRCREARRARCRRGARARAQLRARLDDRGSPQRVAHEIDRTRAAALAARARAAPSWIVDARAEELTRCGRPRLASSSIAASNARVARRRRARAASCAPSRRSARSTAATRSRSCADGAIVRGCRRRRRRAPASLAHAWAAGRSRRAPSGPTGSASRAASG